MQVVEKIEISNAARLKVNKTRLRAKIAIEKEEKYKLYNRKGSTFRGRIMGGINEAKERERTINREVPRLLHDLSETELMHFVKRRLAEIHDISDEQSVCSEQIVITVSVSKETHRLHY